MRTASLSAGFTLLEVLAVMVLLSLLMLAVYAGLQTTTHTVGSGQALIGRLDQVRAVQQFLRRELAQSMAVPIAQNDGGDNLYFSGSEHEMRYAATMPGYLGKLGVQLQRLQLVKGDHGDLQLEASFAMLPPDGSQPQPLAHPEVLLDGIRSGHFSYRGLDEHGVAGDWIAEWPDGRRLPALVSIELDLKGQAEWPPMKIPLRVDPSANQGATDLLRGLRRNIQR